MKKGFTLIELLVVISIIGILAALTLTGFSSARKNARDTQRKSDLGQYRLALESYSTTNGSKYPPEGWNGTSYNTSGIFSLPGPIIVEYLPAKIDDPANSITYRYVYYGAVGAADGLTYKLTALLETGGFWIICSTGRAGKFTPVSPATAPSADSTCDLP